MNDDRGGAVWLPTTPAAHDRGPSGASAWSPVEVPGRQGAVAAVVVHVGGGTAGMPAGVGVGVVGAGSAPPPPPGRLRAPRPWSG